MSMEMQAMHGHTLATATPFVFSEEQRAMIRDAYTNGATDEEFAVLMEIARARRLNPLLRQIHFVNRWDTEKQRKVWSAQVAIDGLRALAERTGLYDGQDEPEYIDDDNGNLRACRVRVWRKDWPRPAVGVAYYEEFVQRAKNGGPNRMWSQMPRVMLAKVAESIALRKAFPEDTSGLYTPEEMGQADNGRGDAEEQQPAPRRARVQQQEPAPRELPAQLPDDAQRQADTQRAANDQRTVPTLPAPPDDGPLGVHDLVQSIRACALPGDVADRWVASADDRAAWSKAEIDAARLEATLRVAELQKCDRKAAQAWLARAVREREGQPPPDGPGGGHRPAGHAPPPDAQGSAAEAAPAQGSVALVPDWCASRAVALDHVEKYTHALAVQRACEKYRAGLPSWARDLLARRYQRLSWDPQDGEVTLESARELVERWIARGPQESRGRREARAKIAAGGAL